MIAIAVPSTLEILRHARATGETIPAADHVEELGYARERSEGACRKYVRRLTIDALTVRSDLAAFERRITQILPSIRDDLERLANVIDDSIEHHWSNEHLLARAQAVRDYLRANLFSDARVAVQADLLQDPVEAAADITERARMVFAESVEPREYRIHDGPGRLKVTSSPPTLVVDVGAAVRKHRGTMPMVARTVIAECDLTGERHTIALPSD